MGTLQLCVTTALSLVYTGLVWMFCRRFSRANFLPVMLTFPIIIFSTGYVMRIYGEKVVVDLGYFLTESASMFVYVIFAGAVVLGQMRYWKK